jgi:hypothetical protein
MVMALINWRVSARLRGKFVLLKRAIGMVASAFQLAGERGIVASRARRLRVGRASGGVVVGQTIDDVVGAAQEPVEYMRSSATRASWAVFPTNRHFR